MSDALSPPPGTSPSAQQIAVDTRVVFSRLRRRLRELTGEESGIPAGQSSVLARLAREGDASSSELARRERVRPQSMATIVAALESAGLVARRPDPADGRKQLVALTERGRAHREESRGAAHAWFTRVLDERCTEEERQTVLRALALLATVADAP
ncbi:MULTISPECIES: MarR family winged helix-turn-helix transcriptional regulator [Streptomyces]|uniref:MarR family transcriptional regulator n=1 Tax=Streptomyces evansiae TaxID=3075535 RepID=A0ABU2R053_9ACTN|nr:MULTISPECIES: MarR family transcriptional regulator [unclassified Streptomyces]MDT0410076.1 MarR family transcriptional regulator [Streptomyces sp. DSM 41979]MYQ61643.1 MarR family transcriptional regulator [Streptomyces sp. SID4926]SCD51790.1 DNA-binding transcriptional regulator, MarR family [Streptomyces sp. DfronAA-171]